MARAIVMPSFGMYTAEGTLATWLKPSGTEVVEGEPIVEIETEKALAEVPAPASGILHHVAEPGTLLEVESLLGYILAAGEEPPELETAPAQPATPAAPAPAARAPTRRPGAFASPNARRLAAMLGVELAGVTGTGPGGRITEADVRAAQEALNR